MRRPKGGGAAEEERGADTRYGVWRKMIRGGRDNGTRNTDGASERATGGTGTREGDRRCGCAASRPDRMRDTGRC